MQKQSSLSLVSGLLMFILMSGFVLLADGMPLQRDTTLMIRQVAVDIKFPEGKVAGYILVLPGWNFSRQEICQKSSFCAKARQKGYCLILPEMRKSAYIHHYFPETREDYRKNLTLSCVVDTLIPYCQEKLKILMPGGNNYLFGISTGGRGVAMVAISTGTLFRAGAALSGDYDQTLQKDDRLMIGYLGPYSSFPERWTGEDNPSMHPDQLKIPLFLGHGKADKVVPVEQSQSFFKKLSTAYPHGGNKLHIDESGGHNYDYWNSEMERIFAFYFEKRQRK